MKASDAPSMTAVDMTTGGTPSASPRRDATGYVSAAAALLVTISVSRPDTMYMATGGAVTPPILLASLTKTDAHAAATPDTSMADDTAKAKPMQMKTSHWMAARPWAGVMHRVRTMRPAVRTAAGNRLISSLFRAPPTICGGLFLGGERGGCERERVGVGGGGERALLHSHRRVWPPGG